MASIEKQVRCADHVICRNIESNANDRGFLSQNLLAQLRNLVEGLIVWAHLGDSSAEFQYAQVGPALDAVKAKSRFRLFGRFHKLLQASASHYTLDGDPSERLMLKYYEYMLRTRDLALKEFDLEILDNLELFPVNLDPSLREYHEKIASCIEEARESPEVPRQERYYIHSSRPFFVGTQIYYEVTFSPAHDCTSKFDRTIAFTDIDITDNYAAYLSVSGESITVLGKTMPILIVRTWEISIRPCEFNNFIRIFGAKSQVQSSHAEYRNLMQYLTTSRSSLLDLVDMNEAEYNQIQDWVLKDSRSAAVIFPALDEARKIVRANQPGSRVLRYLMYQMRNRVIKAQFDSQPNRWLSELCLTSRSSPFDTMPFCTALSGHVPRFGDLVECIDTVGREHELLARRARNNVEQHGAIYTPAAECEELGDLDELIAKHNRLLPPTSRHAPRMLKHANGHVFICGYEDDTVEIIKKFQEAASEGLDGHASDVQHWLDANPDEIDDPSKAEVLEALFERSKVALIIGAAGTGKSTIVNHIASYFAGGSKLFLAQTNPAIDNLRRRISTSNAKFSTIASHVRNVENCDSKYDLLVIDECSTVDNASLLKVLECTQFDLLVLVGDVYQIESIQFGNWFGLARSYIPAGSTFELTKPFRTEDDGLLTLWDRVRKLDDRIEESLSKHGYSMQLGEELFTRWHEDEIVLCLNYDGVYGINNVNRFLQAGNPNPPVSWGEYTFKVGDPVLFNETDRFRPVIFNNMKGTISAIDCVRGRITFDVVLEHEVSESEVALTELRWVSESTVQFDVFERASSDEDNDMLNTLVPFQIAYAVSIHKAQGLEFDSVKLVITDANEERISHSVFYTAITRARRRLGIFWTPETQQRILARLAVRENIKDESLLKVRRGIIPLNARPRRLKERFRP